MATTTDHLEDLTRSEPEPREREAVTPEDVRAQPASSFDRSVAARSRTPLRARLLESIPARWAVTGTVAWVVFLAVGIAVEPPADNPSAGEAWWVSLLGTALLVAMAGTLAGLWQRRRWGLAASLAGSGLLLLSTVMCPVSGHHTHLGAWWVVQLGCGLGLAATSTLGLRRA
jgi:peptidoglycan/LPS O-acetylase OafA/YrhL